MTNNIDNGSAPAAIAIDTAFFRRKA
jgi:hypothetical protein